MSKYDSCREQVGALLEQGISFKGVSRLLGIPYSSLHQCVKRWGMDSQHARPIKQSCADRLLEETPEAYYWLGFLIADGHFGSNRSGRIVRLKLSLAAQDRGQVFAFKDYVQGSAAVYEHRPANPNHQAMYTYCLTDTVAVPLIAEKLHITRVPKTSYPPLMLPTLDSDLFGAFLIGLIDGDGCIYLHSEKYPYVTLTFSNCWESYMQLLCSRLELLTGVRIPYYHSNGKVVLRSGSRTVLDWLKRRHTELRLPVLKRKWGKY